MSSSKSSVVLTGYSSKHDSIHTFFSELESIQQSKDSTTSHETDEEKEEKEEHEIYTNSDAIWLERCGFGSYVSSLQSGEGAEHSEDALLKNSGVSQQHAHAIRRRMNTLRSTVRSGRGRVALDREGGRTDTERGGNFNHSSRHDSRNDHSASHRQRERAKAQHGAPASNGSPSRSPRSSPNLTRRSPASSSHQIPVSYTISASSSESSSRYTRRSNRSAEYNIDSGVYSANSSRDGTPVTGQENAHPPSSTPSSSSSTTIITSSCDTFMTPRSRSRVLMQSSPKHRSNNSTADHNGLHRHRERGEGTILDDTVQSRINPNSLNLVAKTIEPSDAPTASLGHPVRPGRPSSDEYALEMSKERRMVKRSSSDKPLFPSMSSKSSEHLDKRESKSLPRGGNEIRPVSPLLLSGRESATSSPEDIKLHFKSPSHSCAVGPGQNGAQELPNFTISPDALGITRISDLSQADMEKVRGVAFLELTVTFDDHDIPLRSRRPARIKSYPENSLRGVPLSVLLQMDQKRDSNASIPLVFEEMISYLEQHALDNEGILRIPGSTSRINNILQEMEACFHMGQFSFTGSNVNDVCSLLKQFIRELPVPLLTREYLPAFASIADIQGLKEQVRTLNLLILLLPDVHQKVLKRLLIFFEKVIQHSSMNKMDLTNIAMVIAPNLFIRLPSRQSSMDDVTMAQKTSHIVKLLIKYHSLLWTIPGEMLRQIRYLYENEVRRLNPKSVQKAIKQMQNQLLEQQPSKGITTPEVSHHIIRVKAPLFTRVCMAVDICVGVTAGDIITKLQKKSRLNQDVIKKRFSSSTSSSTPVSPVESWPATASSSMESLDKLKVPEEMVDAGEQFLFEAGGNIGERCLPNNTDMYSLYSVNPNAQWIIKPRDCPDLN